MADALVDLLLPLVERLLRALEKLADGTRARLRLVGQRLFALLRRAVAAEDATHLLLRGGGELLDRVAARLDDVAQRRQREEARLLLLLEDDLRERDGRQILLRIVVDDLDVLARADHVGDLLERDVAAALRVVELAVGVAFDDAGLGHLTPFVTRHPPRAQRRRFLDGDMLRGWIPRP